MARYRSSPAVSQIWALMMKPLSSTVRVLNSTPMVVRLSWLNSFLVKRDSRLLFPTPDSPIRTTVRRRQKKSQGINNPLQNQNPGVCLHEVESQNSIRQSCYSHVIHHSLNSCFVFCFCQGVSLLHIWWILRLALICGWLQNLEPIKNSTTPWRQIC